MEACLIVTYRCNARCYMCNTWRYPTRRKREITAQTVARMPSGLKFVNITGGEPALRGDLPEIIEAALEKTSRLVVSTNGYYTDRLIAIAERFGNRIGFRVSLEGLPAANDALRGIKDGFDHGLRTLLLLSGMGIRDIGFGMTVSDRNAKDLLELWRLAVAMNLEFATAVTHNSYYFHKLDNAFQDPGALADEFERLAMDMLKTNRPKNWFRAYFNMGLANKVRGGARPLPCEAGSDVFFIDPVGNLMPCNGSDEPMIMGNLVEEEFDALWSGERAREVRKRVAECRKNCWMIGSAAPAMKKKIWTPAKWVLLNKLSLLKTGKKCDGDIRPLPIHRKRA